MRWGLVAQGIAESPVWASAAGRVLVRFELGTSRVYCGLEGLGVRVQWECPRATDKPNAVCPLWVGVITGRTAIWRVNPHFSL